MAENYGTLEGTLDEHGMLSGEMDDRATLEGEIQFGSGGGGVLDVFQNGQSVVQGRYAYVTVPTFLKDLRADDYHNTVTRLEMEIWNGKANPSDIPTKLSELDNDDNYVQDADYVHTDNNFTDTDKDAIDSIPSVSANPQQTTETLTAIEINGVGYAIEGGGSGTVTDVEVDGVSVVDPVTGKAEIDITSKADKVLDAVAGDFPILLANGNVGNSGKKPSDFLTAADITGKADKSEMSVTTSGDQTTIQLKSGTSATVINQHQDISGKADKSSLGTAAEKDSTALIVVGSTDLAEAGAVRDAIDSAVASSYHHAGTKTCAELVSSLLVRANEGNVYNMTDSGVTTADFIEGAGKPIEEGANVGIAKIAENTYKFDLLSGFIDTSNFIEKSVTSGFVKNDGSIDTNTYQQTETGKGLSTNDYSNTDKAIVDGVTSALAGKVDKEAGKGLSTNDYDNTAKGIVDGVTAALADKVDKVTGKGLSTNDYTNTDKGKVSKIDLTKTHVTGNPISITTDSAQMASGTIIRLNPIETGSGTKSPANPWTISGRNQIEVLSGGKNLFAPSRIKIGTYANNVWSVPSLATGTLAYDAIAFKPNTKYTFSGTYQEGVADKNYRLRVVYTDGTTANIFGSNATTATAFTFISDGAKTIKHLDVAYSSSGGTFTLTNFQIEESASATTYENPNIATDIQLSLGQTVYGAYLDLEKGVLLVTHQIFDLGNVDWTYYTSGATPVFHGVISGAKVYNAGDTVNGIASCYPVGMPATSRSNLIASLPNKSFSWIYNTEQICIKDTSYTSKEAFTTAMTGQKVVYELATPFEIQLTPHEIPLLSGYNYISTNCDEIDTYYKEHGEVASMEDVGNLASVVNNLPKGLIKTKTYRLTPNSNGRIGLGEITDMIPFHIHDITNGYYAVLRVAANNNQYYYAKVYNDAGDNGTLEGTYIVYGFSI